jgi:regulatory protein
MAWGSLSVKGRALRYLAQREHSRAELERKLARRFEGDPEAPAAAQIARALDELAACGLLSEARVAESVLAAQGPRYGSRRLKQTLQAKGLDPALVTATLLQARATELDRAREVWRRRYGAVPTSIPASAAERLRQARFLAGRGFDGEVIRRVLHGAEDGGGEGGGDPD